MLPLDHIGGQLVLIGFLVVGDEFYRAENRHQLGLTQGLLDVLGREGFGPLKHVLDHVGSRIGLGTVILGVLVVSGLKPIEVLHGPGQGQNLVPQGG